MTAGPDLIARLDGVEVLIVEPDPVFGDVFDAAPSLRIVGICRGDPVNIDIPAATKAGIPVLRAPGRNADAVAELTVGLIIAVTRGIVASDADVRAGRWVIDERIPQQRYHGNEIGAMTFGLVGCGAVGRAAGEKLAALGGTVLAFDPYADADDLKPMPFAEGFVARQPYHFVIFGEKARSSPADRARQRVVLMRSPRLEAFVAYAGAASLLVATVIRLRILSAAPVRPESPAQGE